MDNTAKDPALASLLIAGAAASARKRDADLLRRQVDRARAMSVAETDAERNAIRAEARADHAEQARRRRERVA